MQNILRAYNYLILFVIVYMAIDLSSMVFAFKIIGFGPFIGAASSLIFPLTYSIMDIIAEIFGFRIARKIIFYGFIGDFIFAIFTFFISQIPSLNPTETLAYQTVLSSLLRATCAQTIGVLVGGLINIFLISRWKIMTKGKYFWLRSIGSSAIGEAFMLVISVLIALGGVLSVHDITLLIIYAYFYKIIFAIIASPFISITVFFLQRKLEDLNQLFAKPTKSSFDKEDFSPNFL